MLTVAQLHELPVHCKTLFAPVQITGSETPEPGPFTHLHPNEESYLNQPSLSPQKAGGSNSSIECPITLGESPEL